MHSAFAAEEYPERYVGSGSGTDGDWVVERRSGKKSFKPCGSAYDLSC